MTRKRTLIARASQVATRQRIYKTDGGLEVDDIDHFEVRRSRVLWDDIVAVTYHRRRGWAFVTTMAVMTAFFGGLTWLIARTEPEAGWIAFAVMGGPFLLALLIRLIFGVDEVNVFGRRSRATLKFTFRKRKARRTFDMIVAEVRSRTTAVPEATPDLAETPAPESSNIV